MLIIERIWISTAAVKEQKVDQNFHPESRKTKQDCGFCKEVACGVRESKCIHFGTKRRQPGGAGEPPGSGLEEFCRG